MTATGRFDEAAEQGKKALELDPMSPIINAVVSFNSTMARRYDVAIEQGLRTTQLFPDFMPGHAYLGLAQLEAGKPYDAIASFEQSQKLQDIVVVATWLIRAHRATGDVATAEKMTQELERRGQRDYLPPYYMAALYAHGGNRTRAFAELDRALRERTGALVWTKVDPALDPVRDDPRFGAVVGKTHAIGR